MISSARPLFGSEEEISVQRVLASGQLAQGEGVAVSSGTAALHLALLAHDIGAGDEVITTAFTFAATASAILHAGATPIFVDVEPDIYTLDTSLVETAITERTKAIMPVHLYGHPCDMQRLSTGYSLTSTLFAATI
jgi:perosamine synthetase